MEIRFDPKKLKIVKIDEVRPNTWNPKDKNTVEYEKIKKSIELHGQRQPIVVRDNNGFEIIDGEQKWTACKELGFNNILIYDEGILSDKEAKELTIAYQQQVPFNELELSKLVSGLIVEYGDIKIPYSEIEIKSFDNLANYDWEKPPTEQNEWVGMPEFKKQDDNYEIHISFENEDKRNEFMQKIGATIINKVFGKIWCIYYPERERDDVKSIKFE